ncbi:dihydroxyacetone kinase-like protein [Breznakia sp. PF5-3]|uniref:dihydroxyacetone kinase subunit DhaL n=1 Tax=unclassified Breznakia TaxID=2623764 RepID=UPI0024057F60|nr:MULTISPECIES: dihydroxyacetone kinase subunit DhaL [unclassified Breznakia]MDF9824359.1 dihydroxyacetone kinase-like protein [Breznakia sp. PM6-1]MDF9835050.1 dihydroxyacetone kinase-like protein [Breznakia sp. PF5-3]MDF9837779.1 dihydroxyacetone kinase-like protein [Breznakia sp. PFB2-8]MDF9859658.1 dihydroxyacetone kinase-like protein [Breznakia sp. PH5-24]
MEYVANQKNAKITLAIIEAIHENAAYLSEIDGATGDGDHGVNMDKGFMLAKERIQEDMDFSESLKVLGRTLVMDIGGSMGPIYGTMFSRLSRSLKKQDQITKEAVLEALNNAIQGLMDLAGAKVGDKTLLDTLYPATESYKEALKQEKSFKECLKALLDGAEAGKENTKNLVAKIGRAARLGERSKGFLDAGATSCCIILKTMASSMCEDIINE